MRITFSALAIGAMALFAAAPASAYVEFGRPDFPNYLSPPGPGTCDFWRSAWLHACPTAIIVAPPPETPVVPVKARGQVLRKRAK